MTRTERALRINVVKFVVGSILLGLSFWHLQTHPAEKKSITASMRVLQEKVLVLSYKITGYDRETAKEQHSFRRSLEELYATALFLGCMDDDQITELKNTVDKISRDSIDAFKESRYDYMTSGLKFKNILEQSCSQ